MTERLDLISFDFPIWLGFPLGRSAAPNISSRKKRQNPSVDPSETMAEPAAKKVGRV